MNDDRPRPLHEWHEDIGDVVWWLWPIEQPPYVGSPLDIGRTVSLDITVQIGIDLFEVEPKRIGDTGGWPWQDADDETVARLFWTPLPDANRIDVLIRDHIRGGPDPFASETNAVDVLTATLADTCSLASAAIDVIVQGLSKAQRSLLARLQPDGPADPDGQDFTYRVETRGVGLDTCAALARRGIMVGDPGRSFHRGSLGYCRLTPLGLRIREILRKP